MIKFVGALISNRLMFIVKWNKLWKFSKRNNQKNENQHAIFFLDGLCSMYCISRIFFTYFVALKRTLSCPDGQFLDRALEKQYIWYSFMCIVNELKWKSWQALLPYFANQQVANIVPY
jgi:hypothetical protein